MSSFSLSQQAVFVRGLCMGPVVVIVLNVLSLILGRALPMSLYLKMGVPTLLFLAILVAAGRYGRLGKFSIPPHVALFVTGLSLSYFCATLATIGYHRFGILFLLIVAGLGYVYWRFLGWDEKLSQHLPYGYDELEF